ncbi:DUF3299 domain-containing protein [Hellea balneolensis]|uniref:DUF3299 domain-containing protein n=1 Tax=Hellea balneolensis TaxID=287478 RepID=UPI0003F85F04|nr:DUF3299 domain-containing protein [Hellea balneolensis]
MTASKLIIPCLLVALSFGACGEKPATNSASQTETAQNQETSQSVQSNAELLVWEDLMPEGEDARLAELYSEFYEEQERKFREQLTLSQAAKETGDLMSMIDEGSAQDTMDQIGTYNVVDDLNGAKIRLPGYVVPLDFNANFEYEEFLLVPYFGACLHTPPPPPNQIVFVKSSPATKVANINEPVWVEGTMKTGQFGSDLGNSAYELTLSKLEPYEY